MKPALLTIAEAGDLIARRALSPVELVDACIAVTERLDPVLSAYIGFTPDLARAAARRAEAEIMAGRHRGPLHGIPIGLKDIFDTAGLRTTAHSRLLADRVPREDAFSVARLREAGAVIMGKLGTFEFAIGGPSFDLLGPPARNPWDPTRTTTGSSSGSGAAVPVGMVLGATGTDTGGSIRSPASLCGLAGLKPTYGLVSRRGIIPLSQSLDHAGPMCWTVRDVALMLRAMAGHDPRDPTSADRPVPDYAAAIERPVKGRVIGVIRHFHEREHEASPTVRAALEEALAVFRSLGCEVRDVTLPPLADFVATGIAIMLSEAHAIHAADLAATPHLYGEIARDRFTLGGTITAGDVVRAQHRRRALRAAVAAVMRDVDCLFTAGSTFTAPPIDQFPKWMMFKNHSITMPFNVTGQPALVVRCGHEAGTGLPMAFQIVGRPFEEETLLALGAAYEAATNWTARRPALATAA